MAAHNSWATLPSIIIVEILSYLSIIDRLSAATTCKRWRSCLFHPSMWRSMTFKVKYGSRRKTKHLAEMCGKFVREAEVEFNSQVFGDMKECLRILHMFTENANLEKLVLRPSSCQIEWPDRPTESSVNSFIEAIDDIVQHSRRLKHLSLGCISELTDHTEELIHLLTLHQPKTMEVLHITSVKEDPDAYGLITMPTQQIEQFSNLRVLGLDYDYLSNDLLRGFATESRAKLEKLVIHVHGVDPGHEVISNKSWKEVIEYNPQLGVTMNLIHSPEGAECLLDILQPAMPLVRFRMFFCQELNIAAISYISRHMYQRLEAVHIVDGMCYAEPNVYMVQSDEDPFVMLAWKCPNLKHFSLIGYHVSRDDVVAIARLRGNQLETLAIPQCCIYDVDEEEEDDGWVGQKEDDPEFNAEVSKNLGYEWTPVPDDKLHAAVLDDRADAETAYLSILLEDQA